MNGGLVLGGRYEVLSRIGAGGMADVYKARDRKLNRFVAIKVLKREFNEDTKFVSKFKVEAQSAAGLTHPNIVNVYDVAEERGVNYIVMELVEGITLKDYIEKRGQLSSKEVISIAIQVATGIEAAHKNHIVHRDIKPQNIIISREGKVKVTDFGIARAASANTISSDAMGSVHYTSPEQARGSYSDAKSDIYSLGITMYEMLTGRVPFDGDSTVTIAIKHLQEEIVPPSEYAEDVPYSLEQIILKCTQKSPDRRYHNMEELIGDLKLSLVDPDGDFVTIAPTAGSATVMYNPPVDDYDDDEPGYDDDYYPDDDISDDNDDDGGQVFEDEEGEVNPRVRKITRILMTVAAILIGLLIIFLVGKAVGIFRFGPNIPAISTETNEDEVVVPDVVGMTFDEAKAALNEKGLGIQEGERKTSKTYEEGIVISQDPAGKKKVAKNTTVTVVISSGKEEESIDIPNVVGKKEDEAQKTLEAAGFKVESSFEDSDTVEPGYVISQSPDSGKGEKGDTIRIVVSEGTDKVSVPSVVGSDQATGTATLNAVGLTIGAISEEYSTDVEAGIIMSQTPEAGSMVIKGTVISVVISKGDVPVEEQKWMCNANITLNNYGGGPARVVLEQNGQTMTITEGQVLSNPYNLQADGIPGVPTGTVYVYETVTNDPGDGSEPTTEETLIGTTTVNFSRVQ